VGDHLGKPSEAKSQSQHAFRQSLQPNGHLLAEWSAEPWPNCEYTAFVADAWRPSPNNHDRQDTTNSTRSAPMDGVRNYQDGDHWAAGTALARSKSPARQPGFC
jgi:hypothetical protein